MYFVLYYAMKMLLCPGDIKKKIDLMKGTKYDSKASKQKDQ